jgi:hypothetical protein
VRGVREGRGRTVRFTFCCSSWKERAPGLTADEIAGVMKSFWVDWPDTFLPNICRQQHHQSAGRDLQ